MSLTAQERSALDQALRIAISKITVSLLYSTILYYVYKTQIAPAFSYSGLTYREPEPLSYGIALTTVCIVSLVLPGRMIRTSDFMIWFLYIVVGAPSILLAQYSLTLPVDEATRMGLTLAACFVLISLLAPRAPTTGLFGRIRPKSTALVWPAILIFSVGIYAYLLVSLGVQLRLVALLDVYDVREDFGSATSGNLLVGYLLPIQYSVLNPALMARGVYSKRRAFFLAGALGQVLIYAGTGQKTVLLSIAAILGLALLFRTNLRLSGTRLMLATGLASLGTLALDYLTDSIIWSSLFVRRFIVVSGSLTAAYVAVFSNLPKSNFSDVIPFAENPYTIIAPTHIVGAQFVGDIETAANVNLFGHGYLSFGYLGMFAVSFVLIAILWAIDAATWGLPTAVSSLIFLMPTFSLASASVFTTIMTHGLAAGIIVALILPRTGWGRPPSNSRREELPHRSRHLMPQVT